MIKNIDVVDEKGNIVGSTYPKRAQGLIKKGRAQRISDTAIMLHALTQESEESKMALNIYEFFDNQLTKLQEQLRDQDGETAAPVQMQILKTMETFRLAERSEKMIGLVKDNLEMMQESMKAETAPEGAAARETTRQKMIELMEKLLSSETAPQKAPDAAEVRLL